MAAVMIGAGPHKASHTAVAISAAEEPLGELRVRACAGQAERLLAWAAGLAAADLGGRGRRRPGHLLDWQLLSAGERVLDVPARLGARARLLASGDTSKNDPRRCPGGRDHFAAYNGTAPIEVSSGQRKICRLSRSPMQASGRRFASVPGTITPGFRRLGTPAVRGVCNLRRQI